MLATHRLMLTDPDVSLKLPYISMLADYRRADEELHENETADVYENFSAFVERLQLYSLDDSTPSILVPCNSYWLVQDGEVIGTSRLRHWLTGPLAEQGGHIGYDVRPSYRNQGFATNMLALTLEKAARQGLCRVLLTCDRDNAASLRVIEKNGGRMADESPSQLTGKITRRYWIELQ